jgi:hypothetical protein
MLLVDLVGCVSPLQIVMTVWRFFVKVLSVSSGHYL